ncbi:cadherin-like domain-containing protein, partial [bacterium]|nr:cadherin-like domain-containing protein [bacterium]
SDEDAAASNPATVAVTIDDVNDNPVAQDDSGTTTEDTPLVVSVLSNDSDLDGNLVPSSVTIGITPTNGTVQIDATTGDITYSPNPNFFGTDTLTYTVTDDDGGASNVATVIITVGDQNDNPVANDDITGTGEDTPVVINVLANDSDIDGTIVPATLTVTSGPSNGGVVVDATVGTILYTPNLNFFGTDSLTYTVSDEDGGVSNTATLRIAVADVNDLPVAVNDTTSTDEDTPVTVGVLLNDSDVDGTLQSGSVTIVSDVSNGTTSVDPGSGSVIYTPNSNFFGTDSFTYTVTDDDGGVSNLGTVIISVTDNNDSPVATDDAAITSEDTVVVVAVLANDTDVDGTLQPASVTIVNDVSNGTTSVDPSTGAVTYTPNPNFFGTDSFTYTVTDDDGGVSNVATATLTVGDVNDSPVAARDSSTTSEDTPVVISVLDNDSDSDGTLDPTTVSVNGVPTNGETQVDGVTGAITYTPNNNFFGVDSLTYTVSDDDGGVSNAATVVVNVGDINDNPVASNDAAITSEDTQVVISVLSNDSDIDGALDPSSVTIVTQPANGTVQLDPSLGTIAYTPSPNFFGTDSLSYTVGDDDGGISNIAFVAISVGDVNDNPIAADDSTGTSEDTPVVIPVLANDSDLDGSLDPSTLSVVALPSNGLT